MRKIIATTLCLLFIAFGVYASGIGGGGVSDDGIGGAGISDDGIDAVAGSGPSGTGVKIDGEYVLIAGKYWTVD